MEQSNYVVTSAGTGEEGLDLEVSMLVNQGEYTNSTIAEQIDHFDQQLAHYYSKTKDYYEIKACIRFLTEHKQELIDLLHKEPINLDIKIDSYNKTEVEDK